MGIGRTVERKRGLDYHEDLFNPLVVRFDLGRRPAATLIASTESRDASSGAGLRRAALERRRSTTRLSGCTSQAAVTLDDSYFK